MSRSKLQDFEVLSRLGSGSFGTVFKVRRLIDDNLYVMKNVRIVDLSYKEQTEAINEVKILAQLKSPYVVRYYDSFINKDTLHIVMEFCNRGDLQNLLRKAKEKNVEGLKETVVWNICLQVILGLQYLHKKHILHRDLKSANVFLMKDDSNPNYLVKIGDLGVAKLMDTSTALANTIVGTPYYLSPELCKDMPYRDKSDCWALGVLIYECCTLQRPFEAKNQCALILKIIESSVQPPPSRNASPELCDLILWLLQKDPLMRPSIKDILSETFVRDKLRENNMHLPEDLVQLESTDFLRTDYKLFTSGNSSKNNPATVSPISTQEDLPDQFNDDDGEGIAYPKPTLANVGRQQSKITDTEVENEPIAKMTKAPSTRLPVKPPVVDHAIRGDRVRGGNKRITSEKAMSRYQLKPAPSQQGTALSRAESKLEAIGPQKSFKELDVNDMDDDNSHDDISEAKESFRMLGKSQRALSSKDEPAAVATNYDEEYEDREFEEYDDDEKAIPLQHEKDLFDTHEVNNAYDDVPKSNAMNQSSHRLRTDSQDSNFSTFAPNIPFSAQSTADISHQMELDDGESELWSSIWTEKRGYVGNEKDKNVPGGRRTLTGSQPLNTLAEEQQEPPTPQNANDDQGGLEIEQLLEYIDVAKTKAMNALGENLFWKVYDLCEKRMGENTTDSLDDEQNTAFLHELDNVLCEESNTDLEVALEAVFGIKLLLALESKYKHLVQMEQSKARK